jgi:FMN-dependent NADH-azoreductase
MHNFSVPSGLKAYIDAISRAGLTFKYTPTGPVGLISDQKQAILVSSSGGDYGAGPMAALEMNDRYLRNILGFLGIRKIHSLGIPGTAMGLQALAAARTGFARAMDQLVGELAQGLL